MLTTVARTGHRRHARNGVFPVYRIRVQPQSRRLPARLAFSLYSSCVVTVAVVQATATFSLIGFAQGRVEVTGFFFQGQENISPKYLAPATESERDQILKN